LTKKPSKSPMAKNYLKSEIENACEKTLSCKAAARYLGCSYNTFKKYAKKYGLFEKYKNPTGKGVKHSVSRGKRRAPNKYELNDIIDGEHPGYDSGKLKRRLIEAAYKREECEICGFDEPRITDNKVPLVLQYKNGDRTDHRWENLELVCWNCSFLNYGDIPRDNSNLF